MELLICFPNKLNCLRAGTLPYLALKSRGLELQSLNTLHAWRMNKWVTDITAAFKFQAVRAFTSLLIKRQFETITSYKWAWYGCISIVLYCRFQRRKRPRWCGGNESVFFVRCIFRAGFYPWVRKIPWRRKWQPTPVFLPGEFHGWRSLVSGSPWGHKVRHNWVTNLHWMEESCLNRPKRDGVRMAGFLPFRLCSGVSSVQLLSLSSPALHLSF